MFAMDHAATALVLARRYPRVPMPALLVSVQLMELVWVALNLVGIERSTTDPSVHTVAGIHLSYMPYSHSIATMLGAALLAAGVLWTVTRRSDLAAAIGLGIASHLVLDLLVHAPDLALAPGVPTPRLGLGLYSAAPWAAFVLELAYGVLCWRIFRGSRVLLAIIVSLNVANASMFFAALPGPEELLPHRPLLLPLLVLGQIAATLVLTASSRAVRPVAPASPPNRPPCAPRLVECAHVSVSEGRRAWRRARLRRVAAGARGEAG